MGVRRPGREADHSPPSSTENKNAWSYTSTSQYVFMAWCLVKRRDNFTFYLYLTCHKITPVVTFCVRGNEYSGSIITKLLVQENSYQLPKEALVSCS
jgi:hypothetical protein